MKRPYHEKIPMEDTHFGYVNVFYEPHHIKYERWSERSLMPIDTIIKMHRKWGCAEPFCVTVHYAKKKKDAIKKWKKSQNKED